MPEGTIRNPATLGNVKSYRVHYKDATIKVLSAVGATNAWFISSSMWPSNQIIKIEEANSNESIN